MGITKCGPSCINDVGHNELKGDSLQFRDVPLILDEYWYLGILFEQSGGVNKERARRLKGTNEVSSKLSHHKVLTYSELTVFVKKFKTWRCLSGTQ